MPNSLEATLANIPGLGGYLAKRRYNEQAQMGELQQAGALQQIIARQQAAQQEQELQSVVAQSGGKPEATIEALLKTGHPKAIELAAKMKGMLPKPAEPYTLAPDHVRMGPDNQPIAIGAPKPQAAVKAPPMRTRIEGENSIQEEFQPDQTWKEVGRGPRFGKSVVNVNAPSTEALSPESVRDLAIQSMYDSNVLAGYRRDTTAMSRIANERMKVMREAKITSEDVVTGRAGFKADTASLNKITPQYDAIVAFEQTAIRNGKILKELSDKVDTTGVPVAERWIRAGRQSIAGDIDVAKFNAQLHLYRAEAARILTQPNLSGVLSDSARHEMEEFLKGSATAGQIKGVVDLLERDFGNRKATLEEQIGHIRGRMRARQGPGAGEPLPGAPRPANAPAAPTAAPGPNPVDALLEKYK